MQLIILAKQRCLCQLLKYLTFLGENQTPAYDVLDTLFADVLSFHFQIFQSPNNNPPHF